MPYALENLEHGRRPSVAFVAAAEVAPEGSVVVGDVPDGWVWDAVSGALRPRTDAEELEEAKAAKVGELAADAVDSLTAHFTPGAGRDETALLIAGHVLKLCEALEVPPDPRLTAVVETGQKALQKKAEAEAAETAEELEGVSWT